MPTTTTHKDLYKQINLATEDFNNTMENINSEITNKGLNSTLQEKITNSIQTLVEKCKKLDGLAANNIDENEIQKIKSDFRKSTFKWFMQSYCIRRSYEKPRGYAGDFDIIDKIYQNKPIGNNIGYAIDKYYLENIGSQAMRLRKVFIVNKIKSILTKWEKNNKSNLSLIDLGSGPARDIMEILDTSNPFKVTLIDQDSEALEYSKLLLIKHLNITSFNKINLLRIIAGGKYNKIKYGMHDIVMCIGLYDYLDIQTAIKLTRSIYPMVKDDGIMMCSNWNITNPSKTEMEWVCDWHVKHRTKEEMIEIFIKAGIHPENIIHNYDPSGHFHIITISNPKTINYT